MRALKRLAAVHAQTILLDLKGLVDIAVAERELGKEIKTRIRRTWLEELFRIVSLDCGVTFLDTHFKTSATDKSWNGLKDRPSFASISNLNL